MPAVTVIPSDHKAIESYKVTYQGKKQELFKVKEKITTPDGRRVVVCPAQTCAPTKCETCKLCSKSDRDFVVATVAAPTVIKEPEKPAEETTSEGADAVSYTHLTLPTKRIV